jgi:hypothetical protein
MPSNLEKYYAERRAKQDRSGLFNPTPMWEQIKEQGLLPPRVDASLNTGAVYYPNQNSMIAETLSDRDTTYMENERNTLTHEYVHAWNENILKPLIAEISAKKDKTKEEEQFLKATKQLAGDIYPEAEPERPGLEAQAQAARRNLESMSESLQYVDYLKSLASGKKIHPLKDAPEERQGYSIGQMTANALPDPNYSVAIDEQGTHRNASVASDYSILIDMVARLPEATKKAAAQKRLESIKEFPEGSRQKGWMEESKQDLVNPFFKSWEKDFKNPLLK